MKLYLGLTESSAPRQTRIFADSDNRLIDLSLAYAACLTEQQGYLATAYELAAFYFPASIATFLERGEQSQQALEEALAFVRRQGAGGLRGPEGEKIAYGRSEVRLLPPFQNPEKSFVIGFSDKARTEAMPQAAIPPAITNCRKRSLPAASRSSGRGFPTNLTPILAWLSSSAKPARESPPNTPGTT